jgi:predicted Holliday junction resolvase-like endonuclease
MTTVTIMPATLIVAAIAFVAIVYLGFHLRFERWKLEYTKAVRRDAVTRSQAATVGRVSEQLMPYFPDFPWNPKDARFLGSPIDFLVFDGLDDGCVRRVVFVEVKTGSSTLSARERLLRDAIRERRVEWCEINLPALGEPAHSVRSALIGSTRAARHAGT